MPRFKIPFARILALIMGVLFAMGSRQDQARHVTIHLVGDSTMADKPDPDTNPERGWGQMFHLFFNDSAVVINHAINGRSTRSFIDEGSWEKVKAGIRSGDYVIVQFGHNDQKSQDPARYTNPYTSYRRNLEVYVTEIRALRAHPILASSIVRRKFNDQGVLVDTHGVYPWVTRQVAQEQSVPFIDLQLLTEDLVRDAGPEKSKLLYLWLVPGESELHPEGKQDNTHLSVIGATEVARLAAKSLLLQDHPLSVFILRDKL